MTLVCIDGALNSIFVANAYNAPVPDSPDANDEDLIFRGVPWEKCYESMGADNRQMYERCQYTSLAAWDARMFYCEP